MLKRFIFAIAGIGILISTHDTIASDLANQQITQLCKTWGGMIAGRTSEGPKQLSCDHVRKLWDNEYIRVKSEGTLFGSVRALFEPVKNRDMRELKSLTFPKEYVCSYSERNNIAVYCITNSRSMPHTFLLVGSTSGALQKLVITTDVNWTRSYIRDTFFTPDVVINDGFWSFLVDLLLSVNNSVGGQNETYGTFGKAIFMTTNFP